MALLLALLLASVPLGLLATDVWSDVPDDYVHHDDINLITDAGISSGITANTYGPNQFVTRGQMASFIARTAGLGDHDPVVNALTAVTAGTITDQANSATITATSANTPNTHSWTRRSGSRRTNRTSSESTFGVGQNTERPTTPARLARAYQASLTLGEP